MADALEDARTIDAGLAQDLRAVGVHDLRELRALGAAQTWERLLAGDLRDTLACRLALEAAARERQTTASLAPEVREACAAHVRRRLAAEPPRGGGPATRFSVAPPGPSARQVRQDRRRARIVALVLGVPVAAAFGAWLAGHVF